MNIIAIEDLHAKLSTHLNDAARERVEIKAVGRNGLSVMVNGKHRHTSIGIRPNGCCDIDYLHASSERSEFKLYEFPSTEAAVESVLQEISLAVAQP